MARREGDEMSEMVERVAKAIRHKAAEIDHRPGNPNPDGMWFADEFALAAIAAIREHLLQALAAAKCHAPTDTIAFAFNDGIDHAMDLVFALAEKETVTK